MNVVSQDDSFVCPTREVGATYSDPSGVESGATDLGWAGSDTGISTTSLPFRQRVSGVVGLASGTGLDSPTEST